jgi:type II secretory pathway pseudopilin PulG
MKTRSQGFTLAEALLGGLVLAIAIAAILGAYVGQVTLNEHARNLSLAINDANRVIEQIRQENASCTTPDVIPPAGTSWNAWMTTGNPGAPKSIQPNPDANELIVVTCQVRDGGTAPSDYCSGTQQGTGEWKLGTASSPDPLRVTVAVCWRHRNRAIGECGTGAVLTPTDSNGNGVIDSPAMLTTLVTCRG